MNDERIWARRLGSNQRPLGYEPSEHNHLLHSAPHHRGVLGGVPIPPESVSAASEFTP